MDPRDHVRALREVRLMVTGAQAARAAPAGARSARDAQAARRGHLHPARRVGGARRRQRRRGGDARRSPQGGRRAIDRARLRCAVNRREALARIDRRMRRGLQVAESPSAR